MVISMYVSCWPRCISSSTWLSWNEVLWQLEHILSPMKQGQNVSIQCAAPKRNKHYMFTLKQIVGHLESNKGCFISSPYHCLSVYGTFSLKFLHLIVIYFSYKEEHYYYIYLSNHIYKYIMWLFSIFHVKFLFSFLHFMLSNYTFFSTTFN